VTGRAVFLSYASEDAAAAMQISDALRGAGIECWFDQSELRGGDAWDRQIRKQIHDCALFIAVISAHSNARNEGYFRREWRMAVERTHDMADDTPFLLPVVVDGASEAGARVPEQFREVQWTRLPAGETPAAFVERVQRLLSQVEGAGAGAGLATGRPASVRSAPPVHAAEAPKRPAWSARSRVIQVSVVLVLALGAWALFRFMSSRHSASPSPVSTAAAGTVAASTGAAAQKSIAVLPFADMSEKKDQEYFADGMAEEILDLLAKIPALRVIGRTSSFQFKGRNEDLRTIGERLGAAYLVEGSVRKSGSRVRVSAQLVDAGTGTQLWADNYDREFGDILDLQDQVAAGIARALQIAVVGEGARPRRQLQSTEAYTHFLRGRAALDRGDEESIHTAVDELQQALALDPGFTRAAETLALAYMTLFNNGTEPTKTGWPRAAAAARQALQLDPKSALAHAIIGLQHATYDYDWPAARSELDQAVALHTRDSVALYNIAWLAFDIGEYEEAVRLQNQSISIDPLNPDGVQNGGVIYYLMGNLDAAERALRTSMHISPTFPGNHWFLCQVMLQRGDRQGAFREIQAETSSSRDFGLALVYHALGRGKDSDAALARAVRIAGNSAPVNVAILYAYRGERDQAFRWLAKAVDDRDMSLGHKFRNEPKLAPLRSDPRYKALLRRMNLPDH
jgi:TolB-like protein/Flp pilus assembly protein TadD